jgi:succinate dehydrogenase/fumarate reductase flavoprotein subunit
MHLSHMLDSASQRSAPQPKAAESMLDLLVIGSGAGGLSAAVVAAHAGLKVAVIEKASQFGGTTAWSGGWMWIPRNPLARAAGIEEPPDAPLAYLRAELQSAEGSAEPWNEDRLRAYLDAGPRMLAFFAEKTELRFIDGNTIPDFHGNNPHAALGGRSVCAAPFDGRRLGKHIRQLRSPLSQTTLWGLGIAAGAELRHFLNALRSWGSFKVVFKLLLRHARDLLLHGRSMRLVGGHALAAGLMASALARGVRMQAGSAARQLLFEEGKVVGALVDTAQVAIEIRANTVLLACGGFPHDASRVAQILGAHFSAAVPSNTGDGIRMAEQIGALQSRRLSRDWQLAAAHAPVSLVPSRHAAHGQGFTHFPHLVERGKPGLIAVAPDGERFANEADSYYDFMSALRKYGAGAGSDRQPLHAWLICDHRFIRRYGLGAVKPFPFRLSPWIARGYLMRGHSLAELAEQCGLPVQTLLNTVARYNALARAGVDEDFAKGQTPYNRMQGDADEAQRRGSANPCMAALTQAPFYAVRIVSGSLGSFAGLEVNAHGQVLDAQGQPVSGLYAGGNDMESVMGGRYPSGGITLGPAMSFGYLAAQHIAEVHFCTEKAPKSL